MARGRMINQTIDFDPEFNALSMEAQLMYLRTLAFLDRDGLITGHAPALVGRVAPLMPDVLRQISGVIQEWVMQGLVIRYATKSGDVLFFKGFGKNQSGMHYDRETPSRFAPPPGWTYGPKGLVPLDSEPTPAQPESSAQTDSGTTPAEVPQESGDAPEEVRNESAPIEVKDQDQIQEQPEDEEEDAQARDPISETWLECYGEPIPENLQTRFDGLVTECGEAAVIYGIGAGKEAKSRTFGYIAKCARNYIPAASNGNSSGYHVEMPGVYQLSPAEQVAPIPVAGVPTGPPPPLAIDDPWTMALAELKPTLLGAALSWLTGSHLERGEDVEGVPRYRVVVEPRAAVGVEWLTKQTGTVIRRTLGSILRQKIVVEIVAEMEPTP